jgi:hypothetical protein
MDVSAIGADICGQPFSQKLRGLAMAAPLTRGGSSVIASGAKQSSGRELSE